MLLLEFSVEQFRCVVKHRSHRDLTTSLLLWAVDHWTLTLLTWLTLLTLTLLT